MATLEDKILNEKLEYYCSSSSEDEGKDSEGSDSEETKPESVNSGQTPSSSCNEWNGTSSNTGPKGVLKDWQRFKQLESEKKAEQERERLLLIKKLSLTCRSSLDDEKDKLNETDPELAELLEDDFLLEYQKQRMKEMLANASKLQFGTLVNLSSADEFLKAIDNEDKSVTIVVHIYEKNVPGCDAMNGSLISLAQEYPAIKFCNILGSTAGLSKHFKKRGVPALLVYKNGQVIGNFINVSDTLGTDFYASDVESFLLENGIIVDKNCVPKIIANSNDDDSD
ncbi:phosducin-like protein [Microplitis mediator]|uniref:phosducin-like protein n=1 Tax=Microplitis mediator TaxID=375433 RepID=UPI002556AEE4|nr:phosducin-like protein [Microplitis mediator]